ncbi:MAG: hypothetical protein ACWGNK_13735, partial [Desulfobacterales bacterium]
MPEKNIPKTRNQKKGPKAKRDPFSILTVFDRLEVGPVKLEPKRLIAPYRLYLDGHEHRTELIYRYEETVFDRDDPIGRDDKAGI